MAIEGEVMTIHQKIAAAHQENCGKFGMGASEKQMKVFDAPKISDIEEIKQVLQYILDKLHGMDLYMRGNIQAKTIRQHEGQAQHDPDKQAEKMGLASVKQLNEIAAKELDKLTEK